MAMGFQDVTMTQKTQKAGQVNSVRRTFEIIEQLSKVGSKGAGVSELASDLDMPKSTTYRYLDTLRTAGYVVKHDDRYYIGLRFASLGIHAQNRRKAYRDAKPIVEDLASETGERAQFIVEEHGQLICVHWASGNRAVIGDMEVGKTRPIHVTSAGKAILSEMPQEQVDEIIAQLEFEPLTDNSITDPDEFRRELEIVREYGFSINDEEFITGLRSVGVPVVGPDGVIGAFTLSGPIRRLDYGYDSDKTPDILLGAANELELELASYP